MVDISVVHLDVHLPGQRLIVAAIADRFLRLRQHKWGALLIPVNDNCHRSSPINIPNGICRVSMPFRGARGRTWAGGASVG
jgi:hypothetical protein